MADGSMMAAYKAAPNKAQWLKNHPKFAANNPNLVAKNPAQAAPKKEPILDAQTRLLLQGIKGKKLRKALRADLIAGKLNQAQNTQSANPNVNTDFGSSSYDPETNTYSETMAPKQEALLNQSQDLATQGMSAASGLLEGYVQNTGGGSNIAGSRSEGYLNQSSGASGGVAGSTYGGGVGGSPYQYSMGDYSNERAATEDAVYSRLTRNVDRDYNQEFEAMEQRMYNRGIPLDPSNPAYKREMDALNEKYAAIKENASGQAVEMGASELANAYGISSGAFKTNLSGMGQQMSDIQNLSSLGTGAVMPNLPGFQAPPATQTVMPSSFIEAMRQFNLSKKELEQIYKIAVMQNDTARYGIDAQLKVGMANSEDDADENTMN